LILAGLGVFFTMGMPSGPARILLAAPLTQDISESLRYEDRSNGAAGLALATFVVVGRGEPRVDDVDRLSGAVLVAVEDRGDDRLGRVVALAGRPHGGERHGEVVAEPG
jgi:hypothetical protein